MRPIHKERKPFILGFLVRHFGLALLFDRHGHAQGDGPLSFLDMAAEFSPARESMDWPWLNASHHALEQGQELIAH